MTADRADARNQFRTVLRGYDPAQVDRRVHALADTARVASGQVHDLSTRVQELEQEHSQAPSFEHLGQRVGWILTLAEDEAAEMAERAKADWDSALKRAHEAGSWIRDDADRYAEQTRGDADTEAAEALEDARRRADELLAAAKSQLSAAKSQLEQAQLEAGRTISEADALAARVKATSDRELGAATERRDAINAQVAGVRQLLSSLAGAAPALVAGPDPQPPADAEQASR